MRLLSSSAATKATSCAPRRWMITASWVVATSLQSAARFARAAVYVVSVGIVQGFCTENPAPCQVWPIWAMASGAREAAPG